MRLLGAADPLRHRRFGHEERVGDLGGRQAADRAQRERDRRRARERRMTAHEEQDAACRPGRARRMSPSGRVDAAIGAAGVLHHDAVSRRRRASSLRR